MNDESQFKAWTTKGYNFIPIIKTIGNTSETPQSLYQKLANCPYSYLLESGMTHEDKGRYSYIGLASNTRIIIKDNHATYIRNNRVVESLVVEDPLLYIEQIMHSYHVPSLNNHPRFMGGFIGYFGYDTVRYIEPKLHHANHHDSLNVPDILLMLSDEILIYDNLTQEIQVVFHAYADDEDADAKIMQRLSELQTKLSSHVNLEPTPKHNKSTHTNSITEKFESNFLQEDFEAAVLKAIEYFKAGDAMQLILSMRFSKSFTEHPFSLYQALYQMNPSPYMYYLNMGDFYIVGASPEILVRLEDDNITVRPLAGTRRRGKTSEEDKRLETELLSDTKEIAEHLMLIDLGRNDIGRVCQIGTVKITQQMVIERFSHVMHISSTVEGKVQPHVTAMDALRATFPAGTVSGAPKVRAMEIIDELEHEKRGLYGGAIGYFSFSGNADLAIALRTAIIKNEKVYVQAGAGLVADSVPKQEWQECLNKAEALFSATKLAEESSK